MAKTNSIDLLMVEAPDGGLVLAIARSCCVNIGDVVELDRGALRHVVMKAWVGDRDADLHKLIGAYTPVYEVRSAFAPSYTAEVNDAESP